MATKQGPLTGLTVFVFRLVFLSNGSVLAQSDSDPRLEKLAKDLYPKAKQEGSLVVYTILDVEHIRSLLAAFDKRFPGIDTTYWQGTRSEIVTRTLTEFQGDQRSADVSLSEGARENPRKWLDANVKPVWEN
jgi:hypothetical protein